MSAFLTRLAGIALGEPAEGCARLSLPPRYAQPRAGDAGFEAVQVEEAFGGPLLRPVPAPDYRTPAQEHAPDPAPLHSVPAAAVRQASPASVEQAGGVGRARPRSPPSPPADAPDAAPSPLPARAGAQSPVPPPAPVRLRNIAGEPFLPPAPAVAPPSEVRIADAGPNAPPRPPPQRTSPPLAPRERPSAPLSDRALVGRTDRPRQVEPVIHVTIDRIDVRAPASPRPAPAARRPPAEPSVSLSDFLRDGGSGSRQ